MAALAAPQQLGEDVSVLHVRTQLRDGTCGIFVENFVHAVPLLLVDDAGVVVLVYDLLLHWLDAPGLRFVVVPIGPLVEWVP